MFKKSTQVILACMLVLILISCPFSFELVLALEEKTFDYLTSTSDGFLSTNDEVTASNDETNATDDEFATKGETENTVNIEETTSVEETTIFVEESTTHNDTTEPTVIPEGLIYIKHTNSTIIVDYIGNNSDLIIPDTIDGLSVTTIGESAFKDCSNLNSITLPKSISKIEAWAFQNCTGLDSVKISDIKSWCKIDFINTYSNPLYYAENLYLNNELIEDLIIPSGVSTISDFSFINGSFYSVTLPKSIKSIGAWVFEDCKGLDSVYISDVKRWCKIDFTHSYSNPLYYAENLYLNGELIDELIIPSDVSTISDYAFINGRFHTITIPKSIKSVGVWAFEDCSNLTEVLYSGDYNDWNRIDISLGNECLENAYIHFNIGESTVVVVETNPTTESITIVTEPTEITTSDPIETKNTEPTEPTEATTESTPTATELTETTVTDPSESKPVETTVTEPAESELTSTVATLTTDNVTESIESSTSDNYKPTDSTEYSTPDETKPSEPTEDKGILGDVNGDGKVNIKDATQIQKFAAKLAELTEAESLRADVNGDSKVNVKDATVIQKYVAKLETGFLVGEPLVLKKNS